MTTRAEASARIEPATEAHAAGLDRLFAATQRGCYCRYWHFTGDKNAWLLRCATAPEENSAEMRAALVSGASEALGFVAIAEDDVVGWLKLAPASVMQKLYEQRPYRGLPCFQSPRDGVHTIGCFLVAPHRQRQGIARSLLHAAIEWSRVHGVRAIEAFPRRGELLRPADMWLGPAQCYFDAGFVEVNEFAPYPVLRLTLQA
jgi:GNAT superfamily N-acetyltransferase